MNSTTESKGNSELEIKSKRYYAIFYKTFPPWKFILKLVSGMRASRFGLINLTMSIKFVHFEGIIYNQTYYIISHINKTKKRRRIRKIYISPKSFLFQIKLRADEV